MKVIITGSRKARCSSVEIGRMVEASGFPVTMVLCACVSSVDTAAAAWATKKGIPVQHHGTYASYLPRNHALVEHAEALIAVWDGNSRVASNLLKLAMAKGIQVCAEIVP